MLALREFADRDALMEAAAQTIADALQHALTTRGSACAALSGGSTPEPAYARLAALPLDWPRVTFALVDERLAPSTDPASNEAMVRRALAPALAAGARLVPMATPGLDLEAAARAADAAHANLQIDIAIMGMGADGHTASWFPGAEGLSEALDPASAHTVVAVRAAYAAGSTERLTLTRAAIARADRVILLITSEDKKARLEASLSAAPLDAPVAALFTSGATPEVFWSP